MTVAAYLLVQTEVGRAVDVAVAIRGIDGITSADDVTGPYDVIARAEAETLDELGRMVVSEVQRVAGITRTTTCPVVNL
jgi:DNA-binding Lrp family transcriptional regulator